MQHTFPRLDIGSLSDHKEEEVMISRFSDYLTEHQNLFFPHRHSFYHVVLFTEGGGSHTIDFNHFPVNPYQIYFMVPGQVHSWNFEGKMEGYVVNFSNSFFQSFLLKPDYLETFSFFNGITVNSVIELSGRTKERVSDQFEELLQVNADAGQFRENMVRVLLLRLFLTIEQGNSSDRIYQDYPHSNPVVRNFQKLIEKNFADLKLPGEYARLLHVTPNHLNALCKEHLGKQAGELIRDRIVLEAKRLLVNLSLSVSEIAYKLNFNDNSYFTKFFKKEVGMTPESFRTKSANETGVTI